MKAFLSRILNWMMVIILIPSMVGCDADLFGQNKIVAISLTSDTTVIDVDDADTAYITLTASARTKGGKTVTLTPSWEYDEEVFEAIGTPTSTLRLKLNMDGTGPNGKDITGFSTIKAKDSGNPSVFDELVVNVTGDLQSIWFQDADGNRISTVTLNQKETITYDIATYPRAAQGFELIGEADAEHLEVATINVDSLAKQATVTTGFPGTATLKVSTADGRFSTKLDVVVSELEIPDTTASRILIDQGSYLSLAPSEEERILTASAYDQYNQKIEGAVIDWSSSAPEIVSVVRDGARARIKANDVGKATITAFLADDPSLTATMLIEVGTSIQDIIITPYSPESTRARSFSIVEEEDAQMSSSYPIGKNAYYKASYLPASTEDVGVIWSIDDPSIAEIVGVDEEIVEIETKGTGSANLIATSSINPEIASYVTISVFDQDVTPDYSISHISLDKVALEMEQGSSEYIKATAVFQDGSEGITDIVWATDGNAAEISYTSPDTSEIEITAATPGLTTVTATALSNPFLESSATILVYPVGQQPGTELRKIVPSPASLTLIEGRSANVDISYLPPDAEVGILTPVVSSDIIRISDYDDESVTVEGVSKGEAYVTLTSSKDSTVTGRISVKVLSEEEALKPSRIRLSENVLELRKGDHQEINAEVILSDGSIGSGIYDIDWEITSGDGIVGINADGTRLTVTGDEEGEATITASLADNPEITSSIDVIVYSSSAVLGTELRKIIPSQESITLVEGDSTEIRVSYLPEDTDEKGITWSVGDGGIVSADGDAEAVTIKALKKGNTTVTATSSIRPSIKAEISVTVLSVEEAYKPVSVEISGNMLDLEKGSSGQLSASVNLSNGVSSTDYEFIWTVIEGDGIVELTPTGKDVLVKAVDKGEAVVSVTISGYEELSARAVVTVYDVGEIVGTKLS